MPMTAKEYREHLYTQRNHPAGFGTLSSTSQPLSGLYWTLLPFVVGEYWAELRVDSLPSGIVFPTAYLLFWAFYYTYYRPGSLESKLAAPNKWDLFGLPTVLMGICIWFVKVAVVEFTEVLVTAVLPKKRAARPRQQQYHYEAPPSRPSASPAREVDSLPKEISNALAILGLSGCRDWRTIQKRYRELAKKYHPDLNRDITTAGNRFMIYDAAYRRLLVAKDRFFH